MRVEVPDPALLVEPLAELEGRVVERDLLEEPADGVSIDAQARPLDQLVRGHAAGPAVPSRTRLRPSVRLTP